MMVSDTQTAEGMRRRRFMQWIMLLVGLCAGLAWLAWAGHGVDQRNAKPWGFTETGWLRPMPGLTMMWIAALANFVLLSLMAWLLFTTERVPGAIKLKPWLSVLIILVMAVAVRVAIVATWVPTLSDDVFRYRHDGHSVLAGDDVYGVLPQDQGVRVEIYEWTPAREMRKHQPDLLDRFSNIPFQPTVYLPVNQAGFAIGAVAEKLFVDSGRYRADEWPAKRNTRAWDKQLVELAGNARLMPYRIVHVAADVATLALLMWLLMQTGKSVWWAALYGLNPLVLIEVAGNGHLDPVGYVFVIAALLAYAKRRENVAAVMIGLGILCKPLAAVVLPAMVIHKLVTERGSLRAQVWPTVRVGLIVVLTVLLGFVPFAAGIGDLQTTLEMVAKHYHFNGPLFDLLRWLAFGGDSGLVRPVLGLCHLLVQVGMFWMAYRRAWPVAATVMHAMVAFLIFSPQVYPWYVLWPLALLPLAWHAGAWVLSLTSLFSYSVWIVYRATGEWEQPHAVLLLAWVPVIALAIHALFRAMPAASKMSAVTIQGES